MRQVLILLICALFWACAPEPVETPAAETAAPSVVRGTVASADGVPIAYTAQGQGDPALVFIHGGFCDATFWSEQVDVFARDYRIVTLDLAGHGASGIERPEWTLEAYGHDVKAVVEELDLDRILLIGHSMGGPVSLAAAQLMPERVAGIIAVDTLQDMGYEWDEEAWQARMDAFREDFAGACQGMVQDSFREDADPEVVATVRERLCDAPPEVGTALLEMFSSYDMAAQVQAVRAPIRALNADLWPTNVEGNRQYAPGYEAVIMEGTGHFPMLERPEEFNQHLAELIRGLSQE